MIVGWEALHMKKNYDDEQENTTAYPCPPITPGQGMEPKRTGRQNICCPLSDQPFGEWRNHKFWQRFVSLAG